MRVKLAALAAIGISIGWAGVVFAYPFELAVQQTKVKFDGMDMPVYYVKSTTSDGVYLFTHAPSWKFRTQDGGLSIQDSANTSANIFASLRPAFSATTPDSLKQMLINDTMGDLQPEGTPEIAFEEFSWRRQPNWKGYQVIVNYEKFGKKSARCGVYFIMNKTDVFRVIATTSPEKVEKAANDAKRWMGSFKEYSKQEFDKLVKKGT